VPQPDQLDPRADKLPAGEFARWWASGGGSLPSACGSALTTTDPTLTSSGDAAPTATSSQ
jgi:hypothetical protein